MTAAELAEKGIDVYNDRKNWTYVQGALGQLGESDRVRGLYKYFWGQPNHAGNSMTMAYEPWLNLHGKGRRCTDCSNFINFLLGYTFSITSGSLKTRRNYSSPRLWSFLPHLWSLLISRTPLWMPL